MNFHAIASMAGERGPHATSLGNKFCLVGDDLCLAALAAGPSSNDLAWARSNAMETIGIGSATYRNWPSRGPGTVFAKNHIVSWVMFSADYAACTVSARPIPPPKQKKLAKALSLIVALAFAALYLPVGT
jgi:hypothetical protein